jgi:uncharacterized membrane protein
VNVRSLKPIVRSILTAGVMVGLFLVTVILPSVVYMAVHTLPFIQPWKPAFDFLWLLVACALFMVALLVAVARFEDRLVKR